MSINLFSLDIFWGVDQQLIQSNEFRVSRKFLFMLSIISV